MRIHNSRYVNVKPFLRVRIVECYFLGRCSRSIHESEPNCIGVIEFKSQKEKIEELYLWSYSIPVPVLKSLDKKFKNLTFSIKDGPCALIRIPEYLLKND